ncbi:hypothetical protein [Erythrobacter tepidarius]|uniref:hypothetical protein n=1 Tax=Erythrobacter tepidarius TaxID=60454 RepID=UPI000A38725F|nr:hypothetical protein [Erythrobacter tepidarius]
MRIVGAAIAYGAMVFALGFVLGILRVLWLAPLVGLVPATLMELPVMLGASWLASGWLVRRLAIASAGEGLAAGGLAFVLLMAAECALGVAMMGMTPAQWFAEFRQPHALLGLAGQGAFALMPWWRMRRGV